METRIKEIPKFTELEEISKGEEVIVFEEGAMKLLETRFKHNPLTGKAWYNPVFLSEINENGEIKYKEVEVSVESDCPVLNKRIVDKDNEDYNIVRKNWEELR